MSRALLLTYCCALTLQCGSLFAADEAGVLLDEKAKPVGKVKPLRFSQGLVSPLADFWKERSSEDCGIHALWMCLHLQDRKTMEAEVAEFLTPSQQGHSLLELRDTAGKLGHYITVRECVPSELINLPKPFVARMSRDGDEKLAHYVVVFEVAPRMVYYLDGTTAREVAISIDEFGKNFAGQILVAPAPLHWLNIVLGVVIIIQLCGILYIRKRVMT